MEFLKTETGRIIAMVLVIIIAFWLGWLVKKLMYFIYKKASGKHKVDPGRFFLIAAVTRFTILLLGVGYAISLEPSIKSFSTSLLAGAGIATAIVGFAAKDVIANFVSGAVIIIFRPFTITHWINVLDVHEGTVEEIKMLYTVIKDKTNRRMIIPNSKIISTYVINSSYRDERICQYVEFKISYGSDIKKAMEIIGEVAEAHPFCIDNRTSVQKEENKPKVEVRLMNFGEYAITLRALVWVNNPLHARTVRWALNEKVRERFDQIGIEIPFPYRNLILKNDLGINDLSKTIE
jgi:small-conductance mechanosensitive channel